MNRTLIFLIVALALILFVLTVRSSLEKTYPTSTQTALGAPKKDDLSQFATWKEFTWKDGHFSIMLPSVPHHVRDKTPDPRTKEVLYYDTFVSADEDTQGYMINTITFPRNIENDDIDTTLKNVVTDIISRNKENKLNSMKEGDFKNYRAFDFSYANGNRTIHGKVFAVVDTVYMLGVIDTTAATQKETKELDFFMNSFEIINDPTKK